MDIVSSVIVDARTVTITNCRMTSTNEFTALGVNEPATGFTLTDSEIVINGKNGVFGSGTSCATKLLASRTALPRWGMRCC